jgi:hypothetical protein
MVTPVHRLQNINNSGYSSGSSNLNLPRSTRSSIQTVNENGNHSVQHEIEFGQNMNK